MLEQLKHLIEHGQDDRHLEHLAEVTSFSDSRVGIVKFHGVKYVYRMEHGKVVKIMTDVAAGWNWSETLYK